MGITRQDVVDALESLGGKGHNREITRAIRLASPVPLPDGLIKTVRSILSANDAIFESEHGTAARMGIWRLKESQAYALDLDQPPLDDIEMELGDPEGRARLRAHLVRERSWRLVKKFKASLSSFRCEICTFDFRTEYGELGRCFIEAHHKMPVSELDGTKPPSLDDLIALCSNCHRMVHRTEDLSIETVRMMRTALRDLIYVPPVQDAKRK